ncbi:hypothetical protein U1Q18_025809, partial [Sarracenia purpurea var. burkii]
ASQQFVNTVKLLATSKQSASLSTKKKISKHGPPSRKVKVSKQPSEQILFLTSHHHLRVPWEFLLSLLPPDPVNRRRSSSPTNLALRKEHATTTSPHPGNKFSLLSEASDLPEIDAAEHSDTMLDGTDGPRTIPDSTQAQASYHQHSPQSQGKQANKKADSKGKKKRSWLAWCSAWLCCGSWLSAAACHSLAAVSWFDFK